MSDGRVRRSIRSREAIVGALFALVGEGVLQPTAQQVADRSGLTIRTVFRHFSDMEALFAAVDARVQEEAAPLLLGKRPGGTVDERIRGLVAFRGALFERIAPYKRASDLQRWRSPFVDRQQRRLVNALRRDLRRWLPETERVTRDLAGALDLVTSFEAWDRLRREQGLGRARAAAAVEAGLRALLGRRSA